MKIEKIEKEEIRKKILDVLKKHDVKRAALFGSIVRKEAKEGSDIDIVIEFEGEKSLLDLVGLKLELEKLLGKKVDVITYNSIHPLLRKYILNEQEIII